MNIFLGKRGIASVYCDSIIVALGDCWVINTYEVNPC